MGEFDITTIDELENYLRTTDYFGVCFTGDGTVKVNWDIDAPLATTLDNTDGRRRIQRFLESIGFPEGGHVFFFFYNIGNFAELEWSGPEKKGVVHRGLELYVEMEEE